MTSLASNDINIWILTRTNIQIHRVFPTCETLWRIAAVTLVYVHTDAKGRRALYSQYSFLVLSYLEFQPASKPTQHSALWESDSSPPEAFDAARFMCEPEACEWLAFGAGRLICAAMNWAPMAAALIVGAILNRVDRVTYDIERGERVGERTRWDGWTVSYLCACV
ncbi:hypothetical protein MSAN_01249900 [Mycena sanguinolenta]|uniref:Uncharacterized protein n=1 Tax=Mycena sanguinolenta TaxID=230812 RepID=A0A8H6YDH4_9AGAR|nr:hypothetical protein MSAN_01249900 [Mycena sanguinolenta]